jgi:hypothetical protein
MNPLRDSDLVERATDLADRHPRTLRRVGTLPNRDMVVFEDRATGERRKVPNKFILALGDSVAFELSDTQSLLDE